MAHEQAQIIHLSPRRYLAGAAAAAVLILILGIYHPLPAWALAAEVFVTVISLFAFGSMKYRLDKNALTCGAGMIALALWFPISGLRFNGALWPVIYRNLLTFEGLDRLVHADTMLFLLGLTLFVAVIAQTRLLEGVTFFLLRKNGGRVAPTVLAATAVVAAASGILDGVSMIGLTIRTLVIILLLAKAPLRSILFAVIACTAVTTVNGIWLAYGEPPNLIMKANLLAPGGAPLLDDRFFLTYCMPAAVLTYGVIAVCLARQFKGLSVDLGKMDVLDSAAGPVRFLQAMRHGQVLLPVEFAQSRADSLGPAAAPVLARLNRGEPLGAALAAEDVAPAISRSLLGAFVDDPLAEPLDRHYRAAGTGDDAGSRREIIHALHALRGPMALAQRMGALALLPFVGLLLLHARYHAAVPLFLSAFAGFLVAFIGIARLPRVRRLAFHEARLEYSEYLFLFPLFLSISLLARVGFFDELKGLLEAGVHHTGATAMAVAQFWGATILSAILDNNVVADFVSHAIRGLDVTIIHLFAMAQIAGYAAGGCWTHIGSAQSVVAYAFIRRDLDGQFTPLDWIKAMTRPLLAICAILTVYIIAVGWLHGG